MPQIKYKYPIGAELNDKGMEIYGEAIPDGLIPVLTPIADTCSIDGLGMTRIYLINIPLFIQRDLEGYQKSLELLSKKFNVPVRVLDEESRNKGMPLRAELVKCVQLDPRFTV